MPVYELPIEVWERVIDWIPFYNASAGGSYQIQSRDTLRACALVCKSWVPRCQTLLFLRVHLSGTIQGQGFVNIVTRTPAVGRGVFALKISVSQNDTEEARKTPGYYNWIYTVLSILPSFLTRLQTLHFRSLPVLHPNFVSFLSPLKTVHTLHLEDLAHQSFSEITRLINRFPSLKVLGLLECHWPALSTGYPVPKRNNPNLDRLFVRVSGECRKDVLRWLQSTRRLSTLRTMVFCSIDKSLTGVLDECLHHCSGTLRYLSIAYDEVEAGVLEFPSLANHQALECLDLAGTPSDAIPNFAQKIPEALAPNIVAVHLRLDFNPSFLVKDPSSWNSLDVSLSLPKFKNIRLLVIWTNPVQEGDTHRKEIESSFRNMLPMTYKRDILWWGDTVTFNALHISQSDQSCIPRWQLLAPYFS